MQEGDFLELAVPTPRLRSVGNQYSFFSAIAQYKRPIHDHSFFVPKTYVPKRVVFLKQTVIRRFLTTDPFSLLTLV